MTTHIHIQTTPFSRVFGARSGLQSMLQPCPCLRKQGLKDQKNDHAYSHPNNSILSSLRGMVRAAKHATTLPMSQRTTHMFTLKQSSLSQSLNTITYSLLSSRVLFLRGFCRRHVRHPFDRRNRVKLMLSPCEIKLL